MTPEREKEVLELVSTDALYEELLVRFEHVIFSGIKNRPNQNDQSAQVTSWRYKGNPFVCQGLACGIIAECQNARNEVEEEIDKDDL
jgi:hypothetical protein